MTNVKNKRKTNNKKGQKVPNNVRKPLLDTSLHKNSSKGRKKVQKNEVITDRKTDQHSDL